MFGFSDFPEPTEVTYAEGRLPTRTYATRSFRTQFGRDAGSHSRYIYKVFDEAQALVGDNWEWTNHVISTTPGGRKQIQLHVAREAGTVRKLRIQRVPTSGDRTKLETLLELDRDQSARLIDLLRTIDRVPIEGESMVYVDDQLIHDLRAHPSAIADLYYKDADLFRALIESDAEAEDVVALQRRREVVMQMRSWTTDPDVFDAAAAEAGGPERAWQRLLEENPWILGIGLGGQLLTSWHEGSLEQTVVGRSIKGVGKRADALLRTSGVIRSLVFAEIKHHRTPLVGGQPRPGCWRPSTEIAEAVVQAQQTVHMAVGDLTEYINDESPDGEMLPSGTFLLRPRSYLLIGSLGDLTGPNGGAHADKYRSFELFRRNLHEPEIITFDELVARAEWHVQSASVQSVDIP